MASLKFRLGQYSHAGRKSLNQDFYGACIPSEPQLNLKGAAFAISDGISSSEVSHIASETAVKSFLDDYFCTPDAWPVKKSAQRVLNATNSWLHAQTQQSQYRFDKDRGYVCTFSALIIKSATAHIFHVGDARIYRLRDQSLEQLTNDHRQRISAETSYLSRALGINSNLEIDYRALPVASGDIFLLLTDGVYEYLDLRFLLTQLSGENQDLNTIAEAIVIHAEAQGSPDNLTLQIICVDELPAPDAAGVYQQLHELPLPPLLEPRMEFDGYRIARELHSSSRSHVYLATELSSGKTWVLKTPSIDLRGNNDYLERFSMEEWIARRINSAYVLKAGNTGRKRNFLYLVTEYVEGITLRQWMIDNPKPDLETVRTLVEQIAKGLRAFHRLEMLHQDLRPDNILIDNTGTIKIIDFGSTYVAGIAEAQSDGANPGILGTAQYTAPEYFLGETPQINADIFSLGVITYQMLSGRLPYGTAIAKCKTRAAQNRLRYQSVLDDNREIPLWVDEVLKKAVHVNPRSRYQELSEFTHDLRYPSPSSLAKSRPPLLEANPLLFWKSLSAALVVIIILLLAQRV